MEENSDLSDPDLYTAQLNEVFVSCDVDNRGFLDRHQLLSLCSKLQLADHAQVIVDQLLSRAGEDIVRFEKFKESFVTILCGTQVEEGGNTQVIDEEESVDEFEEEHANHICYQEEGADEEIAPLYIKDGKRYGRRSKPMIDPEDIEMLAITGKTTHKQARTRDKVMEDDYPHSKRSKRDHQSSTHKAGPRDSQQDVPQDVQTSQDSVSSLSEEEIEKEMFEAEGQLKLTQSQEMNTGEEYLRNIWSTLGVGSQGYITTPELAQVCEHIGMEQMDSEQLEQLFDKLDTDGDGRVSFNEFLVGVFYYNRPHTPRSLGTPTPRALSAQKKIKLSGEERVTPSIVPSSGASGVFTTLDPDQTGIAMPDSVIDLWEKYNVSNGADILLALEFDLNRKVNLAELSACLEQELINAENHNAVYQAALSSYQQEIRHLKSSAEQSVWQTEKLRQDLAEANHRNAKLAKEVDERHTNMEQGMQKKLSSVETKYQEQIKGLQAELELERENCSSQVAKLKSKLESDIQGLKQEERKLRENYAQSQKEIDRLESEVIEATERQTDAEKQNSRLLRELQSLEELQSRLDEFENTGVLSPEEERFTQEKIEKMQMENKDLKDRNDELTTELESIKLQLPTSSSSLRKEFPVNNSPRGFSSRIPVRNGSFLLDYFGDQKGGARSSFSSEDNEEIEVLKNELRELKSSKEQEQEEIEQTYKEEISKITNCHNDEKRKMEQRFKEEMMKFQEEQKTELAEQQKSLQKEFVNEKQNIIDKYESEKIILQHKFEEEKCEYAESLKEEFSQDLEAQIKEIRQDYDQNRAELDKYLSRPDESQFQQLLQEKSELEEQLFLQTKEEQKQIEEVKQAIIKEYETKMEAERSNFESAILLQSQNHQTALEAERSKFEVQILSQRDQFESEFESKLEEERSNYDQQILCQQQELESKISEEREQMEERIAAELEKLHTKHHKDMENYKQSLSLGLDSLEGKTRDDFFSLLDREKQALSKEQGGQLCTALEQEQQKLEKEFKEKMQQAREKFDEDTEEIVNRYEDQIGILQDQLDRLNEKVEEEREEMERRFEEERDLLEEDLTATIKEELQHHKEQQNQKYQEEFLQQIETLKETFEAEKDILQQQVRMYQAEIEEMQQELDRGDNSHRDADSLNKTVTALQREKNLAEKAQKEMHEAMIQSKEDYEKQIETLQVEHETKLHDLEAKNEQIVRQWHSELNKEKTIVDKLTQERDDLKYTLMSAKEKLEQLDHKVQKLSKEQEQYKTENRQLCAKLELLNNTPKDTEDGIQEKEKITALQVERDSLEKELGRVSDELSDASRKLASHQSEHQREMEQLKDKRNNAVNIMDYTRLQIDLVAHQRQLRELQDSIRVQENEKIEKHKAKEEEFKKLIDDLYDEKANLQRKLKLTQSVLEEQLEKINSHYSDCDKKNVLVVDLYKENANLMEALYVMEERKKDAVTRCYHLEDQCKALRKMLKKVCHVAIS